MAQLIFIPLEVLLGGLICHPGKPILHLCPLIGLVEKFTGMIIIFKVRFQWSLLGERLNFLRIEIVYKNYLTEFNRNLKRPLNGYFVTSLLIVNIFLLVFLKAQTS